MLFMLHGASIVQSSNCNCAVNIAEREEGIKGLHFAICIDKRESETREVSLQKNDFESFFKRSRLYLVIEIFCKQFLRHFGMTH